MRVLRRNRQLVEPHVQDAQRLGASQASAPGIAAFGFEHDLVMLVVQGAARCGRLQTEAHGRRSAVEKRLVEVAGQEGHALSMSPKPGSKLGSA